MEFNVILCLLACFVATTQSRSLARDSSAFDPRDSARFKSFEAKFLQMLGMKEKPRVTGKIVVPQYMLDLYNSRVKDPEYISTNLVFKDFATTANTVRSFYHKGKNFFIPLVCIQLHASFLAAYRRFNYVSLNTVLQQMVFKSQLSE